MSDPILLRVLGVPPSKDGAKSILSPDHRDYPRVQALREAMRETIAERSPFSGVRLRLEMRYYRAAGKGDGLNMINGVADVIQRRCAVTYGSGVWLIDDDANIREFEYVEQPSDYDWYQLAISAFGV